MWRWWGSFPKFTVILFILERSGLNASISNTLFLVVLVLLQCWKMLKKAAVRREEVLSKSKSVQLQIKTLSLVSLFTLLSNSCKGERDTLTNSHILLVALNSNDLLKAPNSYSSEREIMLFVCSASTAGSWCQVLLYHRSVSDSETLCCQSALEHPQ